ncbi:PREDICTED: uncharacterized protein LOC104728174 [Camelina sativa]|uniref:Uncharacterized protein LOC104728174 n=1 Tax=Camelina sativa TaxID=90675 RepID=A0ABM1QL15_CAMSA|nr:PREDICTED: uncharacterized protein LOC104728174 [Camelina sativa]
MSVLEEEASVAKFAYYHSGKFVKIGRHVYYDGGCVRYIEAKASELFEQMMNHLPVSLYGQRVWYKLPFEEQEDQKAVPYYDGAEEEANEEERVCEAEQFEEEVRVERNVAGFVDLDDEYDEYATPVESGGEDDETEEYVRYVKGSGELKFKQVFDSLEAFKKAIVDYVLKTGRNIKYKWMVKAFNDDHSCNVTDYSKIITQEVIARLFLDEFRENPKLIPKVIQADMMKRWNLIAPGDQCRKAKARALEIIQEEHDEQYSRLKDYRLELLDSNVGSTVEVDTFEGEGGGLDVFYRFYVCFARIKKTWCQYSLPIFGIDGCFLKYYTKGQLLAAVGRDSNNQMYPLAWAVVDKEDEENWKWFIGKLQSDLNLRDGVGFTLISDRQKGLLNVVSELLPQVEHRMCARHIYANLKKKHPHRADMKAKFWKVAKSYNSTQYIKRLEKLKMYDMNVYKSVMQKNPKNCSLAYFKSTSSCDDVSNNINESFNNAINVTRELPLVEMLETIRRRAMVHIDIRRKKANNHKGQYSIKAMERVNLEQKKILNCTVIPAGPGEYEVIYIKKLKVEDYISSWYLTSRWRNEYNAHIDAVRGPNFWLKSGQTEIQPPPRPITKGRKSVPKRIKERNESPQKKKSKGKELKVTRERRIIHYGRCFEAGHNTKGCKQSGPLDYKHSKKSKVAGTTELCMGSRQQPQSQVID